MIVYWIIIIVALQDHFYSTMSNLYFGMSNLMMCALLDGLLQKNEKKYLLESRNKIRPICLAT